MHQYSKTSWRRPRAAFISTYPPVKCGIATFTNHIVSACKQTGTESGCVVVAVDDEETAPVYGNEVMLRIAKNDRGAYRHAARVLNNSNIDVVCIQHEFGIFGGEQGGWILDLIRELRKPVVSVFHTVQATPEEAYRRTLACIAHESDQVVVITDHAITLLRDVYGVPAHRMQVIPHGVPDVPFEHPDAHKSALGFDDRRVLMTFGLLGPTKGIDLALEALPEIAERHPDVLYAIVGATHPGVIRHFGGDVYREQLKDRVRQLGVENNVRFIDRYLDEDELVRYLQACDVYISPYPGVDQISSGTLSYAVGIGLAVVSTPYIYARELLARGRGRLVEFGSPAAITHEVNQLLDDDGAWQRLRQTAYRYGRRMTWANVGRAYNALFEELGGPQIRREAADLRIAPTVAIPVHSALQNAAGLLATTSK